MAAKATAQMPRLNFCWRVHCVGEAILCVSVSEGLFLRRRQKEA